MIAMALCLRARAPDRRRADDRPRRDDPGRHPALMKDMQEETGAAVLLITHDLGIVAEMADEVAVMYAGKIAEYGPCDSIFASFRPSLYGRAFQEPAGQDE